MNSEFNSDVLKSGKKQRLGLWKRWGVAFGLLLGWPAFAQFAHAPIKSFSSLELMGGEPFGRVIYGTDGALYGTTLLGGGPSEGTVFKLNKDRTNFIVLHNFTGLAGDGATPYAELLETRDGLLFGTTRNGGAGASGTIFKLKKDGTEYKVLLSFPATGETGANPAAGLIEGRDGLLYGTAHLGGTSNLGTIFGLNKDGTGLRVLHHFASIPQDGLQPTAGLLESTDGAFYGTTYFGGTSNKGTIFKLNRDGTGYRVLFSFSGKSPDGASPYGGLLEGTDGALYGTTAAGGASQLGIVFKLNRDGSGFQVLHSFTGKPSDGAKPYCALVEGADGGLYGTTTLGGSNDQGTLFRLNKDGNGYRVIRSFTGAPDGNSPYAGLTKSSDGFFCGATQYGGSKDFGAVFELKQDGSNYRVQHSFSNGGEGMPPYGTLLEGSGGEFFGASWNGGSTNGGAIFKVNRDGTAFRVLHSFVGNGDGVSAYGALMEGNDKAIYGTTVAGGSARQGTVFKLNQDGSNYRVLYSFDASIGDGTQPYGGLIEGTDGALYGTATYGSFEEQGAIFKIGKDGSGYRVLHRFAGGPDGKNPYAGLTKGSDGVFYGTTTYGGATNIGTIFRLNQDGSNFRVLRQFTGPEKDNDGRYPFAPLLEGSDGALYGTTVYGGATNLGTVFRLNKDGTNYRILHHFMGTSEDGGQPGSGSKLLEGPDGSLYGTTYFGGNMGLGTVYKLNKDGSGFEVIHSFTFDQGGGGNPFAGLRRSTDGAFYGTTIGGGVGCGTMFKVTPSVSLAIESSGNVLLTGPAGFRFSLQYRDDLSPSTQWRDLATILLPAKPAKATFPAFDAKRQKFYRAALVP